MVRYRNFIIFVATNSIVGIIEYTENIDYGLKSKAYPTKIEKFYNNYAADRFSKRSSLYADTGDVINGF